LKLYDSVNSFKEAPLQANKDTAPTINNEIEKAKSSSNLLRKRDFRVSGLESSD
jgi:hypothetical protein